MYPSFMSFLIVKLQGLSHKLQSVMHLFLSNMLLLEYNLRDKKNQWGDSAMKRQKQRIRKVNIFITVEDDEQKQKLTSKSSIKVNEVQKWQSRDEAVTQTKKNVPEVS